MTPTKNLSGGNFACMSQISLPNVMGIFLSRISFTLCLSVRRSVRYQNSDSVARYAFDAHLYGLGHPSIAFNIRATRTVLKPTSNKDEARKIICEVFRIYGVYFTVFFLLSLHLLFIPNSSRVLRLLPVASRRLLFFFFFLVDVV